MVQKRSIDGTLRVKEFLSAQKNPDEYTKYEITLEKLLRYTTKTEDLAYLLSVLISNENDVLFAKTEIETQKPYSYVDLRYIESA